MKVRLLINRSVLTLSVALMGGISLVGGQENPKVDQKDEMSFKKDDGGGVVTRGDVLTGEERDAFVKAHNDIRKEFGLKPVAWSNTVGKYTLQWLKHNGEGYRSASDEGKPIMLVHRPREGEFKQVYGENAACWWGTPGGSVDTDASKAVADWLTEKVEFDKLNAQKPYVIGDEKDKFDDSGRPIVLGHYTQIVWKDSTTIGAAKWTYESKERTVVVIFCNYDPPGNFIGEKPF